MQFGQKTCSGMDPKRANRVLKPTLTGHSVHRMQGMQSLFRYTQKCSLSTESVNFSHSTKNKVYQPLVVCWMKIQNEVKILCLHSVVNILLLRLLME